MFYLVGQWWYRSRGRYARARRQLRGAEECRHIDVSWDEGGWRYWWVLYVFEVLQLEESVTLGLRAVRVSLAADTEKGWKTKSGTCHAIAPYM